MTGTCNNIEETMQTVDREKAALAELASCRSLAATVPVECGQDCEACGCDNAEHELADRLREAEGQ